MLSSFTKKVTSLIVIITDLFLFYLIFVKFMKNVCPPTNQNFHRINKLFFSHQFGFCNGYSTNHPLTNLTEMTRKALDEDTFACGVFIDLQRVFDTVDHGIILPKHNHSGVRGASYQWFKSYLNGSNSIQQLLT